MSSHRRPRASFRLLSSVHPQLDGKLTGLVDLGFHLKSRQISEPLHFRCKMKTNQVFFNQTMLMVLQALCGAKGEQNRTLPEGHRHGIRQ